MNVIERDKLEKIYNINKQLLIAHVDVMTEIQNDYILNKYMTKLNGCYKLLHDQQLELITVMKADKKKHVNYDEICKSFIQ